MADVSGTKRGWAAPAIAFVGYALAVFYLEAGIGSDSDAFSIYKLAPLAVMGIAFLMVINGPVVRPLTGTMQWFYVYILWLVFCGLVSLTPVLSTLRSLQALVPVVLAFALVRRGFNALWLVFAVLVGAAAQVTYGLRSGTLVGIEGEQRLVGLVIANTYALCCALTIVIAVGLWQSGVLRGPWQVLSFALVALGGYGVYLTVGRTAFIAIPVALVVGCLFLGRRLRGRVSRQQVIFATGVIAALAVATERADIIKQWFATGNDKLGTLTGRTEIWSIIWTDLAPASPLVGYGPGAMRFENPRVRQAMGDELTQLASAHNSFFEALLTAGYLGAFLWVGIVVSVVVAAIGYRGRERPLVVSLAVLLVIVAMTIPSMAGFGIGWYALVAVAAMTAQGRVPSHQRGEAEDGVDGQVTLGFSEPSAMSGDFTR